MSQQIQAYSISAPGFYGLNTQDSPLDLNAGFALVAQTASLTSMVVLVHDKVGQG
jgi:hypothetical protein